MNREESSIVTRMLLRNYATYQVISFHFNIFQIVYVTKLARIIDYMPLGLTINQDSVKLTLLVSVNQFKW